MDSAGGQGLDWKELGLRQREKKITIAEAKNKWHLDRVALSKVCGGSKRGLFLAEFSSGAGRRRMQSETETRMLVDAGEEDRRSERRDQLAERSAIGRLYRRHSPPPQNDDSSARYPRYIPTHGELVETKIVACPRYLRGSARVQR